MTTEHEYTGVENREAAVPPAEQQLESSSEHFTQSTEQKVPLSALQSERTQRQQLAEELQMIKDNMAMLERNQSSQYMQREEEWSDDDIPTWGELKKFQSQKEKQYQQTIQELRLAQKHPDYSEVVTKYLPNVLKQNPDLRETLEKTQDYNLAYYLAKNSEEYKAENYKEKKNSDAQRILENSQQVGNLSSVGSTSPIDAAKRYKNMSDEEFRKEVNRNLGYI